MWFGILTVGYIVLKTHALVCVIPALRPVRFLLRHTFHFLFRTPSRGTKPQRRRTCPVFQGLVQSPRTSLVYLIIDALDERSSISGLSSPRAEVLMLLEDLINSQVPNLRICVTSRPEVDIKPVLEPLTLRSVSLHDESGQKEDIETYQVRRRIQS